MESTQQGLSHLPTLKTEVQTQAYGALTLATQGSGEVITTTALSFLFTIVFRTQPLRLYFHACGSSESLLQAQQAFS
ncbi:hypothetical protein I79_012420 [Cricetulus griseus]|uniref:Uncharacterized protein n=1 Tax=Cricetulus griseus TaxID=10029 RepID=G3HNS6_CRIGR|nr:hypothetical protein I79_012420 [Cricetulus griseus]